MTLGAVLIASLLGSLHCAGMCGGFAAVCGGGSGRGMGGTAAYNAGRLMSYAALGAAAGFLAARFDAVAESLLGIHQAATALMVLVLLYMVVRTLGWGRRDTVQIEDPNRKPGPVERLQARVLTLLRKPGHGAPLAVGLLSAALPCGWLWAFVAVAGTTGSAVDGALVMAVFWLGSVPPLIAVGGVARLLGDRLQRYARPLTAVALLVAAAVAVSGTIPTADRVARSHRHAMPAAEAPAVQPDQTEAAAPASQPAAAPASQPTSLPTAPHDCH